MLYTPRAKELQIKAKLPLRNLLHGLHQRFPKVLEEKLGSHPFTGRRPQTTFCLPTLLHMIGLLFCAVTLVPVSHAADAAVKQRVTVTIPRPEASNAGHDQYIQELLRLALERSKGPNEIIDLEWLAADYSHSRLMSDLQNTDNVSAFWTMTTQERERVLRPIRIPLTKGLLGKRVFLIRSEDAAKFAAIRQLSELSELVAGQGSQWPDTFILRANGLPVDASLHFEKLFYMLKARRFDYFPRGIHEAWAELEVHPNEGLMVEPTLMLSYPAPLYFFVNKFNVNLARRIEKGLMAMIEDGSFDQYFYSHPVIRDSLVKLDVKNRNIFELVNPELPPYTPLNDKRLWLDFSSLLETKPESESESESESIQP